MSLVRVLGLIMLAVFLSVLRAAPPVAIPMTYHTWQNKQSFVALAAYSDAITYRRASFFEQPVDFGIRYRQAIQRWEVTALPQQGTLYHQTQPVEQVPFQVSDPDDLLYVPRPGFVGSDGFLFRVEDNQGVSAAARISFQVDAGLVVPESLPPLPQLFTTAAPDAPTSGDSETQDWFIDNSHSHATDEPGAGESDPRHGTPDRPRMTLPPNNVTFAAGTRVFLAGGVETPYRTRSGVSWHQWICAGSGSQPVFFVGKNNGPDKPVITGEAGQELRLQAQFTVFEGLDFRGLRINQRAGLDGGHVAVRHCAIDGMNRGTVGAAITLNQGDVNLFYDVHIQRAGFTEPDLADENDVHGIQISRSQVWILDSLIHDSAGDSVQINAEFAEGIYVGRNKFHSDNENALDFKRRFDLIFVENDLWDYRAIEYGSSGSDGTPLIVNQDTSGQTPTRSTLARNRIWDANGGIRHQGNIIWTNDNLIWHIHHNENAESVSYAITVGNNGETDYVERISCNSFYAVDGGIWIWAGNNAGLKDHQIVGNLFGRLNADSLRPYHLEISGNHIDGTLLDFNHYREPLALRWGSIDRDLAWLRANTDNGDASRDNLNLGYTDALLFDFSLTADSAAVDANLEPSAYGEFFSEYGRSMAFDATGLARPQGGDWDIGAMEFNVSCTIRVADWRLLGSFPIDEDRDTNGIIDIRDYVAAVNLCARNGRAGR